ncbi:transglycosylase SLT domain-containing protein [Runella sp.]|uniref:transglycosylase SLT domain-containing protein n=1 Tax=Runella sp. TaxID=1960881 RepID=UPI003D0E9AD0
MIYEVNIPASIRTAFTDKVRAISAKYGFRPDWLMIVMRFESTINFNTGNHGNGATGLIGFRENTAATLKTTQAVLAAMSRVQQLDYVDKYLAFWKAGEKVNSLTDLYMIVFLPAKAGLPDSTVLFRSGSSGYSGNKAFDTDNKGYFTIGDVGAMIKRYAGNVPVVSQTTAYLLIFVLIIVYFYYHRK